MSIINKEHEEIVDCILEDNFKEDFSDFTKEQQRFIKQFGERCFQWGFDLNGILQNAEMKYEQ